ncbi:MAG: hypothetical protein EPO20_03490 [Betaproteobacteria bacterium]|nr:MAG: hypothetical protein EPO20_03490 [Betaproteobacteria bacterium]
MKDVPREIHLRQIAHFRHADPEYGAGVAAALGSKMAEAPGIKAA